ncbi:MAG: restriction endonuclease subunit S, partial [Anaerolineales bacterium]|nr:restriction endonuclease subunit S [Anaerolineales bacterium]
LLDESFAALAQVHANAARNLVNAREVFEGVLEQEFQNAKENHISKNITELCEIGDGNHGGNYPKKSDMRQSGVPFIRSVNLVNGHISDIDMRFISKEKHKSLKKGHLKTGDVLFTNRGEMGKSAVVDARYDDANLNSQIAFFRCSEQILPWYLYHILQSPFMQEHSTKSQTGAALQQLPIGIISKFEIPLPPLAEQRAIVQRLDGLARETRRLEEVYRQKVEDVEELRKSILKEQLSMDN